MSHAPTPTDNLADGTWPGHEHHVPVPDTSMLPGTAKTQPAKASPWRDAGGAWADTLRGTVRSKPVMAVGAAMVLGALVTHIARARR